MSIRCVTIDDEPLAREGIALALEPYQDISIVEQFSAADDFLLYIATHSLSTIDVMFVDIEMPRMNGFELIEQIAHLPDLPLIVFVTAYDKYAITAFEKQALDYVLKPIDEKRFEQMITRVRRTLASPSLEQEAINLKRQVQQLKLLINDNEMTISVKTDEGYYRIKLFDIYFIESIRDHVCIHLGDKQLITRNTLKYYVKELNNRYLVQIHKSILVNTRHIAHAKKLRFGDAQIMLSNDKQLKVSRRFRHVIDNMLGPDAP